MTAGPTDGGTRQPVAGAPTIPGYEIDAQIGRGGFATVYAAHQEAVGGRVAIKVLHTSETDPDTLLRFRRETRAMGALRGHPHIVTVLDAGVAGDGRPYIVMELIETGSLHTELTRRFAEGEGPFAPAAVADIGIEVASALAAAHTAGILHRDLKPGNVLLNGYGQPLLTDFGIARLADHDASVAGTALSAGFSAPEVIRGERPTVASDVFALGCTLYALLSGASPFRRPGDTGPLPALHRTATEEAPDLRPRGVPDPLWQVVSRALAKDPEDRHRDMAAVVIALQRVQVDLDWPVTTAPVMVGPSGAQPRPVEAEPRTAVVDATPAVADVTPAVVAPVDPRPAATSPGADPPPRRRLLATVALTAMAVLVVAGAVIVGLLWIGSDLEADEAAFEAENPVVQGPLTGVAVQVDSPSAEAIAQLYGLWGLRINTSDFDGAHSLYTAAFQEREPLADFEVEFGPLFVRRVEVTDARPVADGLEVALSFVTTDATADAVDAECTTHAERHTLEQEGDRLLIADIQESRDPRPC